MIKKTIKKAGKKKLAPKDVGALEPSQRRVLIAKDAIRLLKTNKLMARHGVYTTAYIPAGTPPAKQAHTLIPDWIRNGCEVCAIGAVFVSSLKRFDDVSVKSLTDKDLTDTYFEYAQPSTPIFRSELVHYTGRFFTQKQLTMIEIAFEGPFLGLGGAPWRACRLYYQRHRHVLRQEAYDHLLAILQNIVRNKGTFIPTDID